MTHIKVQAASEHIDVAHFRLLFDASTALHTLTLAGGAMGPMLKLITLSAPKRPNKLSLYNSNADGTILLEYLAAIEGDSGVILGMKVTWNDCPNFSGEYGWAFGELYL